MWNITGTHVTTPMSCASKFSSYVTMISYFFIVIINEFFSNPANFNWLKLFIVFSTHNHIFGKVFFHYFFTVLVLFKNCFNKFIISIFTSKIKYWLDKFIINTNKFVSKTTRNVILIFFWVTTIKLSTVFKLNSKSA